MLVNFLVGKLLFLTVLLTGLSLNFKLFVVLTSCLTLSETAFLLASSSALIVPTGFFTADFVVITFVPRFFVVITFVPSSGVRDLRIPWVAVVASPPFLKCLLYLKTEIKC